MDLFNAVKTVNFFSKKEALTPLFTPWGETLLRKLEKNPHRNPAEFVLPEYPRPQMQRSDFLSLNGYWKYAICPDASHPAAFDGRILVPFSPEALLSGVGRQLRPDEYLWYERTLSISELPHKKRAILHFGAADQYAVVYINGKCVRKHLGGYLPFEVDITDYLHAGKNRLSVCVRDLSDTSWHSRGKQRLKRGGMFYTAQSGIWQTVWMEWVSDLYIRNTYISCDYDAKQFTVLVTLNKPLESFSTADGSPGAKEPSAFCTLLDVNKRPLTEASLLCVSEAASSIIANYTCTFTLENPTDWTPEHPYLYYFEIKAGTDCVLSYSAMRCFAVEKNKNGIPLFCLNHKPCFLNGVLDQGYWPDGLYTAPSDEAFIYDISKMKELGFNMIRKHIKIEAARWYYHCDRLGMIVWQDMVNGGSSYLTPFVTWMPTLFPATTQLVDDTRSHLLSRKSRKGRTEWKLECDRTIEHLRCFPCISTWVPFNEGWGQFDSCSITDFIHAKDPERTVDSASGWFDQGAGEFHSIHNYFDRQYATLSERACAITEYGGYACKTAGHISVKKSYGYKTFENSDAFQQAYKKLMKEEILPLKEQGLSAAVYTQLSDVEEEVNGILTYDRRVCKLDSFIP